MINIVILLIIAGCTAAVFFKLNAVKASISIIAAVCSVVVAFNYYESVTSYLGVLGDWSKTFGFLLVAVLFFAILLVGISSIIKEPIDLGLLPERIGKVVSGLILGVIASGLLLVAIAMSPLSASWPYSRFEKATQSSPNKLLLNVDGFVTGLFEILSSGSFSGGKSFSKEHPDFLNKLYLDRLNKPSTQSTPATSANPSNRGNTPGQGGRGGRGGQPGSGRGMGGGMGGGGNYNRGNVEGGGGRGGETNPQE
jgi:hypothetical protein